MDSEADEKRYGDLDTPANDAIEEALIWAGVKEEDTERWAKVVIDNLRAYGFTIKRDQ